MNFRWSASLYRRRSREVSPAAMTQGGAMNSFSHPAASGMRASMMRWSSCWASRSPSPALGIPTGVQPFPGGRRRRRVHQRIGRRPHVRLGLEVVGGAGADRAAQHQRGVLVSLSRKSTLCWSGAAVLWYLCYWMRGSGLADPLLPRCGPNTGVGMQVCVMVATPDFGGATYDDSDPLTGSDKALGLVGFSVFPPLYREGDIPATPLAEIEAWAAGLSVPAYAIDDQTAIKVVDAPSRSSPRGTGGNCSCPRTETCASVLRRCPRRRGG